MKTFINPKNITFRFRAGRVKSTEKFLGKYWPRAHLVFCWKNGVSLEEWINNFQKNKYIIHHIDGKSKNDGIKNLELLSASDHCRKHHYGKSVIRRKRIYYLRRRKNEKDRGKDNGISGSKD